MDGHAGDADAIEGALGTIAAILGRRGLTLDGGAETALGRVADEAVGLIVDQEIATSLRSLAAACRKASPFPYAQAIRRVRLRCRVSVAEAKRAVDLALSTVARGLDVEDMIRGLLRDPLYAEGDDPPAG